MTLTTEAAKTTRATRPKLDAVTAAAVELAREAAEEVAEDFGVGDHLGTVIDGERVVTHLFACTHPAYLTWNWAVTLVRASRARVATVNEVALLPTPESELAPTWVPWGDRIQAGDVAPGMLLPTADNDPRLEPGFTGGEQAADADPAEWAITRSVVAELGLGRERVLSSHGRDLAAERWSAGDHGADNQLSRQAPAECSSCGYLVRLQGRLGTMFGVCTNEYSPSDAQVVSMDHGCGGHSSVVADERGIELPPPMFDTVSVDESLFD
ncbi:DUF3027 domain-containing protein [Aestuariimicrobium soli]|uniref:DUF3027 domain-containing protein n=1 Tax=Aestuariimicrobium soli TaxID=2035834 RepID=UPI003EB9EA3C